jgi:hypothetical protein
VTRDLLDERGSILGRSNEGIHFPLRRFVKTGSGTHLVSYIVGTGGSVPFSGDKAAGA